MSEMNDMPKKDHERVAQECIMSPFSFLFEPPNIGKNA